MALNKKNDNDIAKKDLIWQQSIVKRVKDEKIELSHPQGKERFEKILRQVKKKKSNNK